MKILFTIKEYAKFRGLSEVSVYKKVNSNYSKSIKIDKETYIIVDDTLVQKLKQTNKNKNGQIRELKLKLKAQNSSSDERYIEELNKQIKQLEKKLEKKNNKIDNLQEQKDIMYEKFLATLVNNTNVIEAK